MATQGRATRLIADFQLLDVVGRVAPQLPVMRLTHGPTVSALAGSRFLFVPAFMLLERAAPAELWASSAVLQYLLMLAFAFTNGYVSTLSMMLGPVQEGMSRNEQEPTDVMMSFALVFGILVGSLMALLTQIGVSDRPTC